MRCHRGFWVYAGEKGADISRSAARFAQEQAAEDVPGGSKAAEDWLRTRAGRALRKRWLEEHPDRQQLYLRDNEDTLFPLDKYPSGIADSRKDRNRYPAMVRADVETPQTISYDDVPSRTPAPPSPPMDQSTQEELTAFTKHRDELVEAAFVAEVTALGFATRTNNIEQVVTRSSAITECMGCKIASIVPMSLRASVLRIASDVATHFKASLTQMAMYSDEEANDALRQTQISASDANTSLVQFVRDTLPTSPAFKAMHTNRENFVEATTKNLQNVYWMGEECSAQPIQSSKRRRVHPTIPGPSVSLSTNSYGESESYGCDDVIGEKDSGDKQCDSTTKGDCRDELSVNDDDSSGENSELIAVNSKSSDPSSSDCESDELFQPNSPDASNLDDLDLVPEIPSSFFRPRLPKNDALVVWTELNGDQPRTLHVYPEDLDSLQVDASLTQTALDFFIYRDMSRRKGIVNPCGSELYVLMETARFTRSPRKKLRLFNELNALFDWSYQYLLLPVSGKNHWSFLVIENFTHGGMTTVYHVNSLRKAHSSEYAFDVLKWFLSKVYEQSKDAATAFEWSTFAINTKPQQTNYSDCGIYVLYYMDEISKRIATEEPKSIEGKIATWTSGNFNATKASVYRSQLYRKLLPK